MSGSGSLLYQPKNPFRYGKEFNFDMFNFFPIPTLIVNPDTLILYTNSAHEKLTDFPSTEIIGKKFPYPWWTPTQAQLVISFGAEKVLKKFKNAVEVSFRKKTGTQFIAITYITPVKRNKKVLFYIINYFDITKLRVIEDAVAHIQRSLATVTLEKKDESILFGLTQRQIEVLQLLAYGYSNAAIAKRLDVTVKAVESHISTIYQELYISDDLELHSRVKAALLYFSKWDNVKIEPQVRLKALL